MTEDIVDIREAEKTYPDQWLFFEVLETDEENQPIVGRLIIHSKERDEVEREAITRRDIPHGYLTYTGDPVPNGMVAAL